MSAKQPLKDTVHLVAYDAAGRQVLEEFLPVCDYYEELHPVVDEDEYRRTRHIIRLSGTMYNDDGGIVQQFEVRYDDQGAFLCDGARFDDGTVTGDWERLHDAMG